MGRYQVTRVREAGYASFTRAKRMNIKALLLAVGVFASVLAASLPSLQATAAPAGFVYREGKTLMLDGKPYKFVGYNTFGMTGCEGTAWTPAQMDAYFAQLPPNSATRFWAFNSWETAQYDAFVASAAAHNQKVIPVLANDLADCTYEEGAKSPTWYQTGYKGRFLTWAQTMASRYKDNAAVAYWEIINEAGQTQYQQQGRGTLDGTTMMNFYNTVAGTIKAADPNHLVATGDNAEFSYATGTTGYQQAASGAHVDILSLHDYEYDYISNAPTVSTHFKPTKTAADNLNKPLVIGEVNLSACKGITYAQRSSLLKQRLDGYLAQGASGVLIWNRSQAFYGGECNGENYIIAGTDPVIAMVQGYVVPTGTTPTPTPTDTQAPSRPSGFWASNVRRNTLTLQWNASTDNTGVAGYRVYRNNTLIAQQTGRTVYVSGLQARTSYTFAVEAYDAAGNVSSRAQISATTTR
ncbi:MAG TPA: fibronectin type III domain-containing protein [Candidatus Saccharimonadales bacterium]|nr:fibronectin type III domain-containing protein [Candidatus Saccharimonadales bacterium]